MLASHPSMEFESEIIPLENPDSGKKQHALVPATRDANAMIARVIVPPAKRSIGHLFRALNQAEDEYSGSAARGPPRRFIVQLIYENPHSKKTLLILCFLKTF